MYEFIGRLNKPNKRANCKQDIETGIFSDFIKLLLALLLQRLSFVGNKAIAYISIHSVPIIALHFLCFKIINAVVVIVTEQKKYMTAAFPVLMHTDAWWIAYAAVGIGIPILLDWMVRKIRSLAFSDLG